MNEISKFLASNSQQLLTLLSVIVGGAVTYVSTSAVEKRKNKAQLQREKLNQILIPYCTCLEETIEIFDDSHMADEISYLQCIKKLESPIEYLNAAKRIYLSKESKKFLTKYNEMLNNFKSKIEEEYNDCIERYEQYWKGILGKCPNVLKSVNVDIFINKEAENKIKLAIINNTKISLINDITGVVFFHDKDNHNITNVHFNDKVKETLENIDMGMISWNNIDNEPYELDCIILDYIYTQTLDEREVIKNILNDTLSGAYLLNDIYNVLNNMRKVVIKEIDKIIG